MKEVYEIKDALIVKGVTLNTTLGELLELIPKHYRRDLLGGEDILTVNIHILDDQIRFVVVEKE